MTSEPVFSAVVTSHANLSGLRSVLGQLRYQTRKPDETLVFVSGIGRGDFCRIAEEFPEARLFLEDDLEDWGHTKRAAGLERAAGVWVGFFNDDDMYDRTYVEKMVAAGEDADAVFCGWNEQPECVFRAGSSTSGNFIVRTGLGRSIGWPASAVYENDGVFIERVRSLAGRVERVDEVLYTHNI